MIHASSIKHNELMSINGDVYLCASESESGWMGVVMSTVSVSTDYLDLLMTRGEHYVPTSVRRIDERTIQYSEDPATVQVKLITGDDPWVRTVDPVVYGKWVDKIGCQPVTLLVLTARQYSRLDEPLLIHLAKRIQDRYYDPKLMAWDFRASMFVKPAFVDWYEVVEIVMGRAEPYGPTNPPPWEKSSDELNADYEALCAVYRVYSDPGNH